MDVAFTVTVIALATDAGALYVAAVILVGLRVPSPAGGMSVHVTPAPVLSFVTVAVMMIVVFCAMI